MNFENWDWNIFFKKIYKINKHLLVLGGTGSGKTTWLINFFENCPYRVIFFNSMGHIAIEKRADIVIEEISVLKNILDKELNIKKICFTPTDKVIYNIEEIMKVWNLICGIVYIYEDKVFSEVLTRKGLVKNRDFKKKSNLILINDELMYVCDGEYIMPYHWSNLTRGRNYNISMIGASQRNQNISKIITTQCFFKILFNMDYYEMKALERKIAFITDTQNLPDYHFIFVNGRKAFFYNPILKIDELE